MALFNSAITVSLPIVAVKGPNLGPPRLPEKDAIQQLEEASGAHPLFPGDMEDRALVSLLVRCCVQCRYQ